MKNKVQKQFENRKLRFVYGNVHKLNQKRLTEPTWVSPVFELPKGVCMEDACKIISFLSDEYDANKENERSKLAMVKGVVERLTDYGFVVIDDQHAPRSKDITEIVTYDSVGHFDYLSGHIGWYSAGSTKRNVDAILLKAEIDNAINDCESERE